MVLASSMEQSTSPLCSLLTLKMLERVCNSQGCVHMCICVCMCVCVYTYTQMQQLLVLKFERCSYISWPTPKIFFILHVQRSATQSHLMSSTYHVHVGGLSLAIEGPSKADISCVDNQDGTCTVSYLPVLPGDYSILVKYNDKHIPGSPFSARITGKNIPSPLFHDSNMWVASKGL